jgi:diguanylate cyclase (GGDEF)-like protein/PAS domain S-box-containing protein
MKIRTQFAATTLLAITLALAAAVALLAAKSQVDAAEEEQRLAQDTAHHTANLLVLTQEFALHFEPRAEQQWQQRYSALRDSLQSGSEKLGPQSIAHELQDTLKALPEAFGQLADLAEEIETAATSPLQQRRKEFLIDRILTDSQSLADGAHRWSGDAAAAQRAAEARLHLWGGTAFGLTAALLLLQAVVVVRKVLDPVFRLQAAAAAVEHGRFDVRLRGNVRNELGDLKRSFNAMTDALAQRTAELDQEMARRRHSEAFVRNITDNLPVLVAYLDTEQRYRFVNAALEALLGVSSADAVGRSVKEVLGEERHAQRNGFLERALAGERVAFDVADSTPTGTRHLHNVYIPDVQADGTVAGVYAVSTDVSELKQVQEQLSELARVDALTSLVNRRGAQEKLEQALARRRRHGGALGLLYLDVDHFKRINDQHGHGVGDEVLKEIARRLRGAVRQTDTPARLAGDEFVVLVEHLASPDEAALVAQKVVDSMLAPIPTTAGALRVSCSVGVACTGPSDGDPTADQLLATADRALYEVKKTGRAGYRLAACSRAEKTFPDSGHDTPVAA